MNILTFIRYVHGYEKEFENKISNYEQRNFK